MYSKWWRDASEDGFKVAPGTPGPILFYTGNESPVGEYVNNTGLMWNLGEKLGALLIFVEHRFEPLSHPKLCGLGTERCFAYCTTAQALADYATLINEFRRQHKVRAPVIAFGGSYGGMLAGWLRMKYPGVVDGAIAASAPIWQMASTTERDTMDMPAVAISRGVSAVGGASDQCFKNLRVAWPLLEHIGQSQLGLRLLSERLNTCKPLMSSTQLPQWAQFPYFMMAEGNYPFRSTYITFALTSSGEYPLPAWPLRVACKNLEHDFGWKLAGSTGDVNYTLTMGAISVAVDWDKATGNGAALSEEDIKSSGVLDLASAVANAAGVWYNVSKDKTCWYIRAEETFSGNSNLTDEALAKVIPSEKCAACPPCDNCPPCPVSFCEKSTPCNFTGTLSKTFSWEGVVCNDGLSQIQAQGVGRDFFWPPSVPFRNYTVETVAGPQKLIRGCGYEYSKMGLKGGPIFTDPWSAWITAYYGGRNISHHRNIVWSNGALDPWSGFGGVYPPGGSADGPMVQNINPDGSQISLVLDLGAHHLDLMFPDEHDPPCAGQARAIEEKMIRDWCQEAYNAERIVLYV